MSSDLMELPINSIAILEIGRLRYHFIIGKFKESGRNFTSLTKSSEEKMVKTKLCQDESCILEQVQQKQEIDIIS